LPASDLLSTTTDKESLRATFDHPVSVLKHVTCLLLKLQAENDLINKARIHAEIGNYKRGLGELLSAEEHLLSALAIVETNAATKRQAIIYSIRLAHVYHWQAKWDVALEMFNKLLEKTSETEFFDLKDFVWQHRGKMYFDQGRFEEALQDFENALVLRFEKNDLELVESTQQALSATRCRLAKSNNGFIFNR
jgi:tetratricopeptide (TPR) repeat protein